MAIVSNESNYFNFWDNFWDETHCKLNIYSNGREYRKYNLPEHDNKVIPIELGEEYEIELVNDSYVPVEARILVDGVDVLTGYTDWQKQISPSNGQVWHINARDSLKLKAWPEDKRGGARFVFTDGERSVASQISNNTAKLGTISAIIFKQENKQNYFKIDDEGVKPWRIGPYPWWDDCYPYPHTTWIGLPYEDSVTYGSAIRTNNISGFYKTGESSVGTGAGEYTDQNIKSVNGLLNPVFDKVISVDYMHHSKVKRLLGKEKKVHKTFGIDLSKVSHV